MPFDYKRYPRDWAEVRAKILIRAGGRCECDGECGLHGGRRCVELDRTPAHWARGKIVLTIAHLWQGPCRDCDEAGVKCGIDGHLKALCQRCHLRYDIDYHVHNAAVSRDQKRGQLRFDGKSS